MIQTNTRQKVEIARMASTSEGVAHLSNGKTVFVQGGIEGDVCLVEIMQEKASFARARIVEILKESPWRVSPRCLHAHQCGACLWQCFDYSRQLEAKRNNVIEALVRIAGVSPQYANECVCKVCPSKHIWAYRNKMELQAWVDERGVLQLGFAQHDTHKFFSPAKCLLVHEALQEAARALSGALRYALGADCSQLFRVGLRNSLHCKSLEVALWTKPSSFPHNLLAKTVQSALPATSVVRVIANPGKQRNVKKVEVIEGPGYWNERCFGYKFSTSAPAFFQVNTQQAEELVALALDFIKPHESLRVADLYAGGGTFSLPLAGRGAQVFAVESFSPSVKDLRRNAKRAGLSIDVRGGDAAREIAHAGILDAIVVDPPRAGLDACLPAAIRKSKAKKLCYISCNVQSLARDIKRLQEQGYHLSKVIPVDMFPQTPHVECVALMSRVDK